MANKRKNADSIREPLINNKRSRLSNAGDVSADGTTNIQPRVDPTYGQRSAFPDLHDAGGENDLFYGPANNGSEYLRMVRFEAKAVPNLLVAPISPTAENAKTCNNHDQGYYADGAYTAAPIQPLCCTRDDGTEGADPQEAYYAALHARFSALATTLHSPSPSLITTAQSFYSATYGTWRYKLLYSPPTMALLSQLQQETLMRGLNVLETVLTTSNLAKGKALGVWAWGLLARCRPVGEMVSEEVGILRSLGKRAVWVLKGMRAGMVVEMEEEGRAREDLEDSSEVEMEGESFAGFGQVKFDGDHEPFHEEEEGDEVMEQSLSAENGSEVINATNADLIPSSTQTLDSSSANPPGIPPGPSDPAPVISNALAQVKQHLLSSVTRSSFPTTTSEIAKDGTNSLPRAFANESSRPVVQEVKSPIQKENAKDANTHIYATLDMIITIVGESYGQRDLLDGRVLWDEM